MSVFDILGAIATIIQFVEYGVSFSNKAIAVYHNRDGVTALRKSIREYQQQNDEFKKNLHLRAPNPTSPEALLIQIAEDCHETAKGLLGILDRLIPQDKDISKADAVKIAWRIDQKKTDILTMQQQLEGLRQRCHRQLTVIVSDQQYALARTLKRMERDQQSRDSKAARQLAQLRKDIVIDMVQLQATPSESAEFAKSLFAAQSLATVALPQESIMSSLAYSEMANRQGMIMPPGHCTYDWIYEMTSAAPEPVNFVSWLQNDDGVFWITGKAGSGKSTLMKHICNDRRTRKALDHWAAGRKLLIASHYFWSPGSSMEQSYSGLLRSILYHIFRSCPTLIKPVCDLRWAEALRGKDVRYMPWTDTELQECVKTLLEKNLEIEGTATPCFCIFIDGLDEYHGDEDLANYFASLTNTGRAKICASSRPWNKFEDAFARSRQRGSYLELHRHTQPDIAKVVEGELGAKLTMINRTGEEWKSLVQEVIDRAEGVFLWVTLVLKKELIPCLENREDIQFLKKRLSTVPNDLDAYFRNIFDHIWADEKYRTEIARLFKSCMAARRPLPMAAFRVMVDDHPDTLATSTAIEDSRLWDLPEEIKETSALVNGRCQDLLAVVSPQDINDCGSHHPGYLYRIEFLHRSVQDFLNMSDSVQERIEQYAGYALFNMHFTLFACYVFLIKRASKMIRVEYHDLLCLIPRHTDGWATIDLQKAARNWSSEAFFHMRSIPPGPSCARLLRTLDVGMQAIYAQVDDGICHWSNHTVENRSWYGNPLLLHDLDVTERGSRDLLGHLIELGLTKHVETSLKADPGRLERKKGRPYLDYALRYKRDASTEPKRPEELESSLAMVSMLLGYSLDVNQKVEIHGGRTVWESYVYFLFDNDFGDDHHRRVAWLLIDHGAEHTQNRVCSVDHKKAPRSNSHDDVVEVRAGSSDQYSALSVLWMLKELFGDEEANAMQKAIMANGQNKRRWTWLSKISCLSVRNRSPEPVKNFVWEDMSNIVEF